MIRCVLVLSLGLLVSGCGGGQQTNTQTNTQARFDLLRARLAGSFAESKACGEKIKSDPASLAIEQIIPVNEPLRASVAQLANKSRPMPRQAQTIVAYQQAVDNCNELAYSKLDQVLPMMSQSGRNSDRKSDAIIADLSQGKLNFGEATQALQLEEHRHREEANRYWQSVIASFVQQNNAELAQRQVVQAQQAADMAALGAQLQSTANQFNGYAAQTSQQMGTFQAPQVAPLQLGGGSNFIYCHQLGSVTACH